MKLSRVKNIFCAVTALFSALAFAQNLPQKLESAIRNLQNSEAAAAATISVYVADNEGKEIYHYNANEGLSTASTQKIFTAACAIDVLGKDFHYITTISSDGKILDGKLAGNLWISSDGDPTLGSWRYDGFKPEDFKQKLLKEIQAKKITEITGNIIVDDTFFDDQPVPGGWPWNDMGNYYGAGIWGINWRENQFDINLDGNKILKTNPELPSVKIVNELKPAGETDNSLIFTAPHSPFILVNGSVPDKRLTISGAMPEPPLTLGYEIADFLKKSGINLKGSVSAVSDSKADKTKLQGMEKRQEILAWQSPPISKIVYWLMRKSINLYAEALIKTMGKKIKNDGSFSAGMQLLKNYWHEKGIPVSQINFADGSGLSPQNYVSAKAEVMALLYVKKQPWFSVFYDGFPVQENGMKMKSGTMKNVKSYAGLYGNYVFSVIINNYQGADSGSALQKILNTLK